MELMAQWFVVLVALAERLSLVPNTRMVRDSHHKS